MPFLNHVVFVISPVSMSVKETSNLCFPTFSAIVLFFVGRKEVIAGASLVLFTVIVIVFESLFKLSFTMNFTVLFPT